ncbi:exocyst complex component EXO84C isoform X1 [Carex littledalei]|uniref:Exocyst complex component EXO84C isoform X1 n=1 Tax=Carex littledalei TaxID=544730 RepID=A0A833VJK0_9POAL|nr:exocyst complex component EXO84C isoform X1 [Carex littledalei]
MESSEEDDEYVAHEWITPQSSVSAAFQSHTEKGIRKLCSELLELKDAVENLCGNMQSKYLAFLRLHEEVVEVEHELITLQKHVSAQGILVQDLIRGVSRELETWEKLDPDRTKPDPVCAELTEFLAKITPDPKPTFLETLDALIVEHRVEDALLLLETEDRENDETTELLKTKILDQLVTVAQQPSLSIFELKKALTGLVKLEKPVLAHQLLLKSYGSKLQKRVESFIPSCSVYQETYPATLSQLVFSTISNAAKDSVSLFGDTSSYTSRLVQWAEYEIETFVRLVKENSPLLETASALRSASVCIQASLSHCAILEKQQKVLKFSKVVLVLLTPYMEEILDLNFRRARRRVVEMGRDGDAEVMLTSSAKVFMSVIKDNLDQLTPMAISHFGGIVLNKILQLFDRYVEILIKALPNTEDDSLIDSKEHLCFRAETDAQQLALIGAAYSVSDELLPVAVSQFFNLQSEKEGPGGGVNLEYKEWRRHLGHSLDKLRDHFSRQYVLNFVYSREGEARLDARMYLQGKGDDLFWDPEALPSFPFQLASVAGDVLLGKEKVQKILLSRLTETVVMWLSDEQEFWDVFENDTAQLQPSGLQQLILDMRFIVEIAVCGRYSSRTIHQLVSAIITRAISAFSARGIDPQSALPEDEWFVDTAKAAISKLVQGTSGSDLSDEHDEHVILHDDDDDEEEEESDSDESTDSIPSLDESSCDSFASATAGEIESPVYFTDPDES